MANFLKKIVERGQSRSKSPHKAVNRDFEHWQQPRYYEKFNAEYAHSPISPSSARRSRHSRGDERPRGMGSDFPHASGRVFQLPLPPSPVSRHSRNSSRLSHHRSESNDDSMGQIRTWNSEKEEQPASPFFLQKSPDVNSNFPAEPRLFEEAEGADWRPPSDGHEDSLPHRSRSYSPRKNMKSPEKPNRSKSPQKKPTQTFDYLQSQCQLEGCSGSIVVQSARFLVCKQQLSHASEYFRELFGSHRLTGSHDIAVSVSGLACPNAVTQFKWFLESAVPCPALRDITDDTLETCMRLSKRFLAKGLELRCAHFILEQVTTRAPIVALCWLNWALKHRFEQRVVSACLPVVARLPLASLEEHRQMLSERLFADVLAAKLRACFDKAARVFETIHKMDHFCVDLDKCPRCGRVKEQGKVRVHANPCRKLVGCERCMQDKGCEIEFSEDLQAYYRCPHGLRAMNERTEDCECETTRLRVHLESALRPVAMPPSLNGSSSHLLTPPPRRDL